MYIVYIKGQSFLYAQMLMVALMVQWLSLQKVDLVDWFQILSEAVWVSLNANGLERCMKATILVQAMCK